MPSVASRMHSHAVLKHFIFTGYTIFAICGELELSLGLCLVLVLLLFLVSHCCYRNSCRKII